MIHHGNQQVEQHYDVDQREASEHDEAPEPGELLDPSELEVVQVYQAERRPEQGLWRLPEAEIIKMFGANQIAFDFKSDWIN